MAEMPASLQRSGFLAYRHTPPGSGGIQFARKLRVAF